MLLIDDDDDDDDDVGTKKNGMFQIKFLINITCGII